MRWTSIGVLLVTASLAMAAEDKGRTVHFAKQDAGKLPAGWKAEKTGTGEGSIWKVVADDTAPSKSGYVLAQTAESPGSMFNLRRAFPLMPAFRRIACNPAGAKPASGISSA